MPDDEITDALAASLLKKEAAERSLRYSAFGLVAFAGDRKKPNSAPKPNTRFLKNLVKEADSHNAALLAKEAEEARVRLEKFKRDERRNRDKDRKRERSRSGDRRRRRRSRSRSPNERSSRRKEQSRSRSKDRRRTDREEDRHREKRPRVEVGDLDRLLQASRRGMRDGEKEKTRDKDREHRNGERDRSRSRERRTRKDRENRERRRSRSHDRTKGHRSRRSRSRSYSPSRSTSSPDRRRHRSHRHRLSRSPSNPRSQSPKKRKPLRSPKARRLSPLQDDEDPLEPWLAGGKSESSSPEIGPSALSKYKTKNGPKPRGRGLPGSSAMDARFDPSYDPSMDVTPTNPEDEDDWEAALEALRDRQKWKQQGKERLKAAGFDDNFIEAWETNTTKDETRIKWSSEKGGREWDRGKVVDEETGDVRLKASWGT